MKPADGHREERRRAKRAENARTDGARPADGGAVRPIVIGWKEYVEFPDWPFRRVKVKIDTGARTSALDVQNYTLRETPTGTVADLRLALSHHHPEDEHTVTVPVLRTVVVANSGGVRERRPLVEARIRFGPVTKSVALTLTNRANMLFRMILGRKALEGDFIVDVSRKYLLNQRSR